MWDIVNTMEEVGLLPTPSFPVVHPPDAKWRSMAAEAELDWPNVILWYNEERTIDFLFAKYKKRVTQFRIDHILEALTSKMQRVDARGFAHVVSIANKPWYQYFARQSDLIREYDSDDDLPDTEDTKPPAAAKRDDNNHAPTGNAMSLLILLFNSFGQGEIFLRLRPPTPCTALCIWLHCLVFWKCLLSL